MSLRQVFSNIYNKIFPPSPATTEDEVLTTPLKATSTFFKPAPEKNYRNIYDWYEDSIKLSQYRKALYREFDQMDSESPELSTSLNVYADDVSGGDSSDQKLKVLTKNQKLESQIKEIKQNAEIDKYLWARARTLPKYGEIFDELVFDSQKNLVRIKTLPGEAVTRNEDCFGRLLPVAFIQKSFSTEGVIAEFEKWEIVHFRLLRNLRGRYGTSILMPARKPYKQLTMLEDSAIVSFLTRATQRYGFLIDIQNVPAEDVNDYLQQAKDMNKKRPTIDPATNSVNYDYNPMSIEEDLYIGVSKDSKADIKTLPGHNSFRPEILEYFQNKLFVCTNVSKARCGLERDVNAKATLTEQDVQFAKNVRRIQMALLVGYREVFDIALLFKGFTVSDPINEYSLSLPVPSMVDELRRWKVVELKVNIASNLKQAFNIPDYFIYKNILELSEDDIKEIQSEMVAQAINADPERVKQDMSKSELLKQAENISLSDFDRLYESAIPRNGKTVRDVKAEKEKIVNDLKYFTDWQLEKGVKCL